MHHFHVSTRTTSEKIECINDLKLNAFVICFVCFINFLTVASGEDGAVQSSDTDSPSRTSWTRPCALRSGISLWLTMTSAALVTFPFGFVAEQ